MSFTKKQLTAFEDILAWCPENKRAVHSTFDRYAITDGSICVVLDERPDGFPMDNDGKAYCDFCQAEIDNGDHQLVENISIPDLKTDCKLAIRQWKENMRHHTPGTPDQPRVQIQSDSGEVSAWYDARKVQNILAAVGPKPMVYIGKRSRGGFRIPTVTLIVSACDSTFPYAVLLPLRIR